MKKILCILLSLTFIFSGFVFSYAEEEEVQIVLSEEFVNNSELLKALEIADLSEINPQAEISRQEFIKYLYMLSVGHKFPSENKAVSYYDDVTNPEYIPYINAMTDLKVVKGFSDGSFGAKNNITVFEALTLILRVLGHDVVAEANNGYPYGYVFAAKKAGILKNKDINGNSYLTYEMMAEFFVNSLKVAAYERKITAGSEISYQPTDKTLLDMLDIGYTEGILEGIDLTKLYGGNGISPWHLMINGKIYDIGKTNPDSLLGLNVCMYYNKSDEKVLHIYEKSSANEILTFDIKDIEDIRGNNILISENEKTKNYIFTSSASVIYNMAATKEGLNMSMLKDASGNRLTGTVTIINNDRESGYDVVKVMAGKNIIVGAIDPINHELQDLNSKERFYGDLSSDEPYVEIYDYTGNKMDFSGIKLMNTVTIYKSRNDAKQTLIWMYVSTDKVSGKLDYISDGKELEISVNGVSYIVAEDCRSLFSDLSVGYSYTFHLNTKGFVSGYSRFASSGNWGMVITGGYKGNLMDDEAYLKIMTSDKNIKLYSLSDKIKIDGQLFKDKKTAMDYLKKSSKTDFGSTHDNIYTQLLIFNTDSDGNINYIDTVLKNIENEATINDIESGNSLFAKRFADAEAFNESGVSNFNGGLIIMDSTTIFLRPYKSAPPEEIKNEDGYNIVTRSSKIVNRHSYTINGYYTDDEVLACSVACMSASVSSNLSANSPLCVIDKVTESLSPDGASVYKLSFYLKGSYETKYMYKNTAFDLYEYIDGSGDGKYISSNTADSRNFIRTYYGSDIKRGDVVAYSEDSYGIINEFAIIYSAEEDKQLRFWHYNNYINHLKGNSYATQKRVYTGYAYKTYKDGIEYAVMEKTVNDDGSIDLSQIESIPHYTHFTSSSKFLYYSQSSNKLYTATIANIKPYLIDKNDASRIVVQHDYSATPLVYIIGE